MLLFNLCHIGIEWMSGFTKSCQCGKDNIFLNGEAYFDLECIIQLPA